MPAGAGDVSSSHTQTTGNLLCWGTHIDLVFLQPSKTLLLVSVFLTAAKLRSWGQQTLDESWTWAKVTLSPVPEELVLQFEPWGHSVSLSSLHLGALKPHWEPAERPSVSSEPVLSSWLRWLGEQWASWQPGWSDSFSVRPLSHTPQLLS